MKNVIVTASLGRKTVNCVASIGGHGPSHLIDGAIAKAAQREATFFAFVQEGIDDLDAGRTVSHEDVMAELDAIIAKHQARCSA
ncbi:MAG: hypothetical protein K2W81_06825 [Sphingomonas sp.]|uniref:hypothetical protein n=1 Tax=Sphingomonas sp. TaxID=28214 RepID=UPI0025F5649D|nr:hypothetical protein [Sphingomonas sp.]MBY0283662.1 hypothetical protein [Sphingomonas sp.]